MSIFIRICLLAIALLSGGCASHFVYRIDVPEDARDEEVAILLYPDTIHLTEFDGERFVAKYTMWAGGVGGSRTIYMKPGVHTLRVLFSQVLIGGTSVSAGPAQLTYDFKKGKRYTLVYNGTYKISEDHEAK